MEPMAEVTQPANGGRCCSLGGWTLSGHSQPLASPLALSACFLRPSDSSLEVTFSHN